jgi:putative membrane protein
MHRSVRSAACLTAAALLIAACSSSNDKPYAHESQRHPTAAEQMYGATGSNYSPAPPSAVVAAEPTPSMSTAPGAPVTVPQPVAMIAPTDAAFAQKVAASNAAEIELSRIAYVRAHSPEVRSFAQQLLIDHRQMAINLDNFALERGHLVVWQIEPEMASNIERIRTLDGAAFDKAYLDLMVEAHSKSVTTLETQAASGRETASLANASLPTVRHHLEMARALDAKV